MGHGQHLNLERIWRELSTSTPIPLRDLYMAINTLQTNIISLKQFTYPLNLQLQCICHCRCLEARWCQALSMFWDCTADALAWSGVRPWACSVFLLKRCLQMLQHTQVPGHEHERWVSEWVIKFNSLSGDGGQRGPFSPYEPCNHSLYIAIIIFPHIGNTQSTAQATINFKRKGIKKKNNKKMRAPINLTNHWRKRFWISLHNESAIT